MAIRAKYGKGEGIIERGGGGRGRTLGMSGKKGEWRRYGREERREKSEAWREMKEQEGEKTRVAERKTRRE